MTIWALSTYSSILQTRFIVHFIPVWITEVIIEWYLQVIRAFFTNKGWFIYILWIITILTIRAINNLSAGNLYIVISANHWFVPATNYGLFPNNTLLFICIIYVIILAYFFFLTLANIIWIRKRIFVLLAFGTLMLFLGNNNY